MKKHYTKGMPSVIHNVRQCWVCKSANVEEHHVFFGRNRNNAERYGYKVWLCPKHHRGRPDGVHGGNRELDLRLKRIGQRHFERMFDREKFIEVFGKSYIWDDFENNEKE